MKVFHLKVSVVQGSQKMFSCPVFFRLTLTLGIDILFENFTPETGR